METIAKMLGYSNIHTAKIYAKVSDATVSIIESNGTKFVYKKHKLIII